MNEQSEEIIKKQLSVLRDEKLKLLEEQAQSLEERIKKYEEIKTYAEIKKFLWETLKNSKLSVMEARCVLRDLKENLDYYASNLKL